MTEGEFDALMKTAWRECLTDFGCTRRTTTAFAVTSPLQRVITTSILLIMVATIIPYQFAYLVLCLVQLATSVRALRLAQETVSFRPSIPSQRRVCSYSCSGSSPSTFPSSSSGFTILPSTGSHPFPRITTSSPSCPTSSLSKPCLLATSSLACNLHGAWSTTSCCFHWDCMQQSMVLVMHTSCIIWSMECVLGWSSFILLQYSKQGVGWRSSRGVLVVGLHLRRQEMGMSRRYLDGLRK
jgi:hypothetical protein